MLNVPRTGSGKTSTAARAEGRGIFGSLFEDSIPTSARIYILSIILAGAGVLAFSFYRSILSLDPKFFYLIALTILGGWFTVQIPLFVLERQSLSMASGEILLFVVIVLYGPEAAALLAVIEGLTATIRVRVKRSYKRAFNLAQLALVAFVVGHLFDRWNTTIPVSISGQKGDLPGILISGVCFGLLYFFLNSAIVAVAVALSTRRPLFGLWRGSFAWAFPANVVSASSGFAICVYFRQIKYSFTLAIFLALIGIIYGQRAWLKGRAAKIETASQREGRHVASK